MEHKPFAVIAPVAVAAILILGILSGIPSTAAAQLSKTVKKPYVSKTVKTGATKTAYRTQGASNGKKRTELTISVSRNGPAKSAGPGYSFSSWVPVILSGRLTSEGSGVAGAMILFSCNDETCDADETVQNPTAHYTAGAVQYANTDSGGHYSVGVRLSDHRYFKGTKIEASFTGDQIANEHLHLQSSEASIKVK